MSLLIYKDKTFYVDRRTLDPLTSVARDDCKKYSFNKSSDMVLFNLGAYFDEEEKAYLFEKLRIFLSTKERNLKAFKEELLKGSVNFQGVGLNYDNTSLFIATQDEVFFFIDADEIGFLDLTKTHFTGAGFYAARVCHAKKVSIEKTFYIASQTNCYVSKSYDTICMNELLPFRAYSEKELLKIKGQ